MQRYLTLVVLLLLTIPVGISIQGCANHNSGYCNGAGYGYTTTAPVSITLGPQANGLSVAFGQQTTLTTPQAFTCKGTTAAVGTYEYGSSDRTIADVSPTGAVCAGTWNTTTPAVASYTICQPTNKQGIAYMTASAAGFTSNQVAVYVHPPLSNIGISSYPASTLSVTGNSIASPTCLSQSQTATLDATAYYTNSSGQQTLLCSPDYTVDPSTGAVTYGPTDCNNVIGHVIYSASNPGVVSINTATALATAQQPGSTLILGSISNTGATSGYFYTCPPKTIALSVASSGATSASITPNTPLPLTATVTDVNNNVINGLALTYVSTNPSSIAVSSAGAVTASFPSSSAITAVCEPSTCNPAPINVIGSLGTGAPIISNSVQVTSPGQVSNYIWAASPSSPYFVPTDLTTGTTGNPVKLPYTPNSMVLDPTGNYLYFGSYRELMIYSTLSSGLAAEVPNVPGVVLAVNPTNTSVVVNDQNRGVLYILAPTLTAAGATITTSFAGVAEKAAFSPDGQTVYMVGKNVLYTYNTYTGWSVQNLPADRAGSTTGICPANNSASYPFDPNTNPPNTPSNPNNAYNMFCSPDLAITVPSAAAFLSGSPTSAYGICPETNASPIVYYPEATTVAATSDHLAATTDGKHIIGAVANPPTLTDVSVNVPINSCPIVNNQTTGFTFNPVPTFNQVSLSGYGITNIDQVVASTNSLETFVTYSSNATAPPAGGALLPVYEPSAQAGAVGTLVNVHLTGSAIAPIAGIFSPDNTIFFVSTTGDDQLHLINTSTLTDTKQLNPKLIDINGNPVPPVFLAVKPRPTT